MTNEKEQIKDYGTCPVCGKGKISEVTQGYTCDHFKSVDDQCGFIIYKSYFGHELTEDEVKQLIETGETGVIDDFHKKDGTPFLASLKIEDGVVSPSFSNRVLKVKCPVCNEPIEELKSGYACKTHLSFDRDSGKRCFYVPKVFCGIELSIDTIETLLKEKRTPMIDGFVSKAGKDYATRLVLADTGEIKFDSKLCTCPKCGGDILVGGKSIYCSNYKNEDVKCDFSVWREISHRVIKFEELVMLCEKGKTKLLRGFVSKESQKYDAYLELDNEKKVKIAVTDKNKE
jgi:hypothetical protein